MASFVSASSEPQTAAKRTPEDVMRTARCVLETPPCLTAVGNGAEMFVGGAL